MKTGREWGAVVYFDTITEENKSLSVARILIYSAVWQYINGWIYLSIGGRGYKVLVKEIGREEYSAICFNNFDTRGKRPSKSSDSNSANFESYQSDGNQEGNIPVIQGVKGSDSDLNDNDRANFNAN